MLQFNRSMHLAAAVMQMVGGVRAQGGHSSPTLQEAASLPMAVSTMMSSLRIGNLNPKEAPSALLLAPSACTSKGLDVRCKASFKAPHNFNPGYQRPTGVLHLNMLLHFPTRCSTRDVIESSKAVPYLHWVPLRTREHHLETGRGLHKATSAC